jgi:hypothetical protein
MKNEKYPSKYSNGKEVSAAQFLTETICERKAFILKEDLHYRFWVHQKWAAFYKNQIGSAHKLLKIYSCKAILRALSTNEGKKIYSLRAPHLIAMIENQEHLIKNENISLTKEISRNEDVKFGSNTKINKSIISKLKDLDS